MNEPKTTRWSGLWSWGWTCIIARWPWRCRRMEAGSRRPAKWAMGLSALGLHAVN